MHAPAGHVPSEGHFLDLRTNRNRSHLCTSCVCCVACMPCQTQPRQPRRVVQYAKSMWMTRSLTVKPYT